MWVAPTHRQRGMGKILVQSLFDWAATKARQEMYLFVGAHNQAAQALYASMGFLPTGRSEPLPWDPAIIDIEMTQKLGTSLTA
ncbi:MAG: GNAT family N-acetyltransferase [Gammaproteobacteria bacterium]|nr:MAG: GNAT family N-acetyltransferase [Gammaproteobacteria bacterium]